MTCIERFAAVVRIGRRMVGLVSYNALSFIILYLYIRGGRHVKDDVSFTASRSNKEGSMKEGAASVM